MGNGMKNNEGKFLLIDAILISRYLIFWWSKKKNLKQIKTVSKEQKEQKVQKEQKEQNVQKEQTEQNVQNVQTEIRNEKPIPYEVNNICTSKESIFVAPFENNRLTYFSFLALWKSKFSNSYYSFLNRQSAIEILDLIYKSPNNSKNYILKEK